MSRSGHSSQRVYIPAGSDTSGFGVSTIIGSTGSVGFSLGCCDGVFTVVDSLGHSVGCKLDNVTNMISRSGIY